LIPRTKKSNIPTSSRSFHFLKSWRLPSLTRLLIRNVVPNFIKLYWTYLATGQAALQTGLFELPQAS